MAQETLPNNFSQLLHIPPSTPYVGPQCLHLRALDIIIRVVSSVASSVLALKKLDSINTWFWHVRTGFASLFCSS